MQSDYFIWETSPQGISTLTLNRPEIHNAFNDEMIVQITGLFKEVDAKNTRLVIVRGNGKSFCAGADLNWMKSMKDYTEDENREDSKRLQEMFHAINDCPVPTLGVIHGAALGGGSGLVSCLDYVLAEENTMFGFTEVKLGLLPAVISPFVMAKIGYSHARSLFTSAERFPASKALEIGLVHRIEKQEDIEARVEKLKAHYLSSAPIACQLAKELSEQVNQDLLNSEKVNQYTRDFIAKVRVTPEAQEGMSAMLEKRRPNWVK